MSAVWRSEQVLHLPTFWKGLPPGSELKRELAQPVEYAARWMVPARLLALGLMLIVHDAVGYGMLTLVGAGVSGWWMRLLTGRARDARDVWARSMYCRVCPAAFVAV
ncbi:hypothetical protein [Streptomyces zhihengii]|uniref:Uncharacterized protein n=1 Tax=Streptomyces zhihengii TaxID=1818004 RepID=A0ABS2V679_9ACTN|nr:hypothetical protein [Streptomyces zhihengii]MBM9624420.1 hypothetical protein [Streptomyces zhihengii]